MKSNSSPLANVAQQRSIPRESNCIEQRLRRHIYLSGILALLILAPVAVVEAQYIYTTNNGTIAITRYTGAGGLLSIPSTINGWPVTTIGNLAFNSTRLTSVTIPNSVTSVGVNAFAFCTSLGSVSIPNSVTNIGGFAFYACSSLTSLTLPDSLTFIENNTFCLCSLLLLFLNIETADRSCLERCFWHWSQIHCLSNQAVEQ